MQPRYEKLAKSYSTLLAFLPAGAARMLQGHNKPLTLTGAAAVKAKAKAALGIIDSATESGSAASSTKGISTSGAESYTAAGGFGVKTKSKTSVTCNPTQPYPNLPNPT